MIPPDAMAVVTVATLAALEQPPAVVAVVDRACPPALFALALAVIDSDPGFSTRWQAAGDDWVAQGEVLHDVVVWILTPEPAPAGVRS